MNSNKTEHSQTEIDRKWLPFLNKIDGYCNMDRALEVELGVRADVERGAVPREFYNSLKRLNWDANEFRDEFLKEISNENRIKVDSRSSRDKSDSGSDMSPEECGEGHMVDNCPEGCTDGECEHPRTD